jgi:ferritin
VGIATPTRYAVRTNADAGRERPVRAAMRGRVRMGRTTEMIGKKIAKALNEQINAELYSFYIYLAMAAWLEDKDWTGMAKWMVAQAKEEMNHAMKIYKYLHERRGTVTLAAIAKPEGTWTTPLSAFEAALAHERTITGRIGSLVELARTTKDHGTDAFLQWFVNEQVEEEATLEPIIAKLTMAGDNVAALIGMDRYLGARE